MKSIKTLSILALVLLAGGAFAAQEAIACGCSQKMAEKHEMSQQHGCPKMQAPHMKGQKGHGGMHGNMHGNASESTITDAQRQEARALVEKAQEKLMPLKQQLFVKHQELEALQGAATPDVAAVSQKAQEIVTLQQSIADERKALGQAIDKVLGLEPGTHSFSKERGHR